MVGVAQLVRASDCGSEGRGFESRRPPHMRALGPLAQLAEQGTLNPKVIGSTPIRPTISVFLDAGAGFEGAIFAPARLEYSEVFNRRSRL